MNLLSAVRIYFGGDEAALVVETGDRRCLVVSDTHLGYEVELAREGIVFPSQLPSILERIQTLVRRFKVDTLVLLGDVKHRVAGISWRESRQVTDMLQSLKDAVNQILITPGNHDAGIMTLAQGLAEVTSSRGVKVGDVWMLHGHSWPPPQAAYAKLILIGHTHPMISFARGVGSRRKVFLLMKAARSKVVDVLAGKSGKSDTRGAGPPSGSVMLVVMPHFNNSLQGVELSQLLSGGRSISPLLRSGVFNLYGASILMLDGTRLGGVEWYVRAGESW